MKVTHEWQFWKYSKNPEVTLYTTKRSIFDQVWPKPATFKMSFFKTKIRNSGPVWKTFITDKEQVQCYMYASGTAPMSNKNTTCASIWASRYATFLFEGTCIPRKTVPWTALKNSLWSNSSSFPFKPSQTFSIRLLTLQPGNVYGVLGARPGCVQQVCHKLYGQAMFAGIVMNKHAGS